MKKRIPMFTFDVPITREGDDFKIVDIRMLNEAKEFTRKKRRKIKRKSLIDDDDGSVMSPGDEKGEGVEEGDEFLDEDQFSMIDDDFRGAEEYNTHMSRLGSVIRNIEMRERKIRTNLLRKTGKEIEREEKESELEAAASRKRKLTRRKKKKKSGNMSPVGRGRKRKVENEYDLEDHFIDDDVYGGYVRMGGSSEEEDDELIDMGGWIQDDEDDGDMKYPYTVPEQGKRRQSQGKSTPFQVPPSPLRQKKAKTKRKLDYGKDFQPDLVDALRKLEKKCESMKNTTKGKKGRFNWDDIGDELSAVAVLRAKYFKKGIPRKLTTVMLTFPILQDFSDGTVRKNLRDLWHVHEVSDLDRKVHENTLKLKSMILQQYFQRLTAIPNLGPVPPVLDPHFLSLVREKNISVLWSMEMNQTFYILITTLRDLIKKNNSLKKKKGKYFRNKRVVEEEVHAKYEEIKAILPADQQLSFVQKYRQLETYFKSNPIVVKKDPPRKKTLPPSRGMAQRIVPKLAPPQQMVAPPPGTTAILRQPVQPPGLPVPPPPVLPSSSSTSAPARSSTPTLPVLPMATNTNIVSTLSPKTPPAKSAHTMKLRKREMAFRGELSPGASMKEGNLTFDDEESQDEDELDDEEEEEELKTPQKRKVSTILQPSIETSVVPPPPTTTQTTTTTTSSVEQQKEQKEKKEMDEVIVIESSSEEEKKTGKKRKRDDGDEQQQNEEEVGNPKKKVKLDFQTVQ